MLNLSKLLGGKSFTVSSQLGQNGSWFAISALGDSGALRYLFIDIQLAVQLVKYFSIKVKQLNQLCPIWGYNGKLRTPIEHAIFLNWEVDRKIFKNKLFLIKDLRQHNVIIGLKWLNTWKILMDCHWRPFIWLEEASQEEEIWSQLMVTLPKQILKCPDPRSNSFEIQADVDCWERLTAYKDKIQAVKKNLSKSKEKTRVPFRPCLLRTKKFNYLQNLQWMEKELQDCKPEQSELNGLLIYLRLISWDSVPPHSIYSPGS